MTKYLIILTCLFMLGSKTSWADVNVVVIAPQEGAFAQYGREITEGVKIAANDINSKGGILGQKINLIVADDRCDDNYAISMAQMLGVKKEDKINLVIGPFCHNRFNDVAEIYKQNGIMQIMPLPINSDEKNVRYIAGLKSASAKAFFEYYLNNLSGQNVAIVYDSSDRESVETATVLQKEFTNDNITSKLTGYSLRAYGKNYNLLAKEILLNNKIVFVLAKDEDIYELRKIIRRNNEEALIFATRYVAKEFEIDGQGQYYLGLKAFKDSPYFTETLVNLRLFGAEPDGLGIYGFAALKFWSDIVQKAQSFSYDKVQSAFGNNSAVLPWGKMSDIKYKIPLLYGVFEKQGEEYTQVN